MGEHRAEPTWIDRQKAGMAEARAHIDAGAERQHAVQAAQQMPAGWYANPSNPAQLVYWNGSAWVVDQARPTNPGTDSATILIAWLVAILSIGYMLPWAVACSRDMPNQGAVGLVNLLTGWTIIGWFVALVMASVQRKV